MYLEKTIRKKKKRDKYFKKVEKGDESVQKRAEKEMVRVFRQKWRRRRRAASKMLLKRL